MRQIALQVALIRVAFIFLGLGSQNAKKRIKQIIGLFLYLACAVDTMLLKALNSLTTQ